MVAKHNYAQQYQDIMDAHKNEIERNIAEFERQYKTKLEQVEKIVAQAQKKSEHSATRSREHHEYTTGEPAADPTTAAHTHPSPRRAHINSVQSRRPKGMGAIRR